MTTLRHTAKWELPSIYLVLVVLSVFCQAPLIWPVVTALTPKAQLYLEVPREITLDNFVTAFQRGQSITLLVNSLIYAGGTTLLAIAVCAMGGYTLSRLDFPLKKTLMYGVLLIQVIPGTATILPLFLVIRDMHLINTRVGVILAVTAGRIPFLLWMMKGFFDAIPMELEEAAWLDGAGSFQALARIVFPLALPGVGAGAALTFSGAWGAFLIPLIFLSSPEKFPFSMGLFRAIVGYTYVDYGMMAAMAILYTAPSLILFVFTRRYMIRGTMAGAMAGG